VGVLGMSVGGLYAAALAARHPDRVSALAVVAAPTETRTETGAAEAVIERLRPEFAAWAAGIDVADPSDEALAARWLGSLPAPDAALLAALGAEDVAASAREALADPDGYLRDAARLFSDWGVDLAAIGCPTHLWFGAHDDRNPPANGEWWRARVPHAGLTVTDTTHLATLLANWPAVLHALVGPSPPASGDAGSAGGAAT
jgi:pimeloyl-ACP methyl ester carboxylesterase